MSLKSELELKYIKRLRAIGCTLQRQLLVKKLDCMSYTQQCCTRLNIYYRQVNLETKQHINAQVCVICNGFLNRTCVKECISSFKEILLHYSTSQLILIFFLCLFSCFVCWCSILCILNFCIFCVLFFLLYTAVSFLFVYKFSDHCHRVETQLQ